MDLFLIEISLDTARSFPALLGYGAGLAITMSGFDYSGGLWGYEKNTQTDEYERRTQLRKAYRKPGEETIAELGEGRGMSFYVRWLTRRMNIGLGTDRM